MTDSRWKAWDDVAKEWRFIPVEEMGANHALEDHTDVAVTDKANGDQLVYDEDEGKWVNKKINSYFPGGW